MNLLSGKGTTSYSKVLKKNKVNGMILNKISFDPQTLDFYKNNCDKDYQNCNNRLTAESITESEKNKKKQDFINKCNKTKRILQTSGRYSLFSETL